MSKYKLIHKPTGQETICEKVTIGEYDYYVNNTPCKFGELCVTAQGNVVPSNSAHEHLQGKKLIATNNLTYKFAAYVENEVHKLAASDSYDRHLTYNTEYMHAYIKGYEKSQETHPYSEEDMITFAKWANRKEDKSKKELLEIWKSQQIKTIYYE